MNSSARTLNKTTSALIVAFAISIWSFVIWQSASDLRTYSVGDLETRIVGARCLMDGINPYHRLMDGIDDRAGQALPEYYRVSGPTTPSPAHLLLYAPLRNLSIDTQRQIYFGIDWVLVFACFVAIRKVVDERVPSAVPLFLFSSLLVFDATFRLHLASGQLYFSLLLLSTIAAIGLRRREPGWLFPLAFAALLLLRPTYLVAFAALVLLGYKLFATRVLIAFALLAVLILPLTGIEAWNNWARMIRQAPDTLLDLKEAGLAESQTAHEGSATATVSNRKFLSLHGFERDRTFLGLLTSGPMRNAATRHPRLNRDLLLNLNLALLILSAAAGLYFAFRLRSTSDAVPRIALVFLLPITIESFGPLRFAYSDVLLTLPLILVASSIAIDLSRKYGEWGLAMTILLSGAFVFAALSRIPTPIPASVFSVGRFFATLAALHLFCIRQAKRRSPAVMQLESTTASSRTLAPPFPVPPCYPKPQVIWNSCL